MLLNFILVDCRENFRPAADPNNYPLSSDVSNESSSSLGEIPINAKPSLMR